MQSDRITEALKFLSGVSLLSDLSDNTRELLARTSKFQHFEKGAVLFFQSDPSDWAYVVRSGSVSISLSHADGRDMVINEMRPGDIFGELGVLTARPRSTSAIARVDSHVLVIPSQTFLRVLDLEPPLARRVLQITAERLHTSGKREGALAFLDAQARLASLLLELEAQEKDKGYVTVSQEELAHQTGLIRQTVAKALGKWRRAGWLITGRGRILILNRKALEDLKSNLLV